MDELTMERTKEMAVAVVSQSLMRAEEGDAFEIAWLSSKQAQKWLDYLNIPQSSMLARTGWMMWAAQVSQESPYWPVVQESLSYMEDLLHG